MVKRKSGLPEHAAATIKSVVEKLLELVSEDDEPAKPPAKKPGDPSVKLGIDFYMKAHHQEFNSYPYLTIADKVALGRLYRELSDFESIVTAYLRSDDPWISKHGYAPRFIPSQVEAIRKATTVIKENSAKEWR